ncbi:MAG: hypothetical protein ABII26_06245 [Pseudomonadota bacterium]
MGPTGISDFQPQHINIEGSPSRPSQGNGVDFQRVLGLESLNQVRNNASITGATPVFMEHPFAISQEPPLNMVSNEEAISAYKKQENGPIPSHKMSDLEKYKDDQLLSNPGGDHYYLEENRVVPSPKGQESFWGRIGKDLSDTFANVKNFFKDLFIGSTIRYRDENDRIQEAEQRGFFGSVIDFFKDLGSALSLGLWRPDGEEEPQGFGERVGFFFSKIKDAIFGDLIQGISGSIIHMGEDLIFAGWNLLETIPDATIGNFQMGKRLTTAVFDNGQVLLDYLTDILPMGEAWIRVHTPNLKNLRLPILNNAEMPEHNAEDARWRYVRNTPFRKIIETIGSLITDVFTLKILGETKLFSDDQKENHRF